MLNAIKKFLGLTFYTSSLDQFLTKFDAEQTHLTHAQQQEVDKHNRIFKKRDTHTMQTETNHEHASHHKRCALWDNF